MSVNQGFSGNKPAVVWFTGLSGSGKSTLAEALLPILRQRYGAAAYLLDGDVLRQGLNRDLDFSPAGRSENIRRSGEVARLLADAGLIVLTAFISPFRAGRDAVRRRLPDGSFFEVWVSAPLEVCEARDVKGLYRKARAGQIPEFTGISSPYEPPLHPELTLDTASTSLSSCLAQLLGMLEQHGILRKPDLELE